MNKGIITEWICDAEEIHMIMDICDSAFEKSIINRDDFDELSSKIYNYSYFLTAKSNDKIAGYAAVYANNMNTCIAYLTLIGVRPEFQNRRIGALLLSECEKKAKECGMEKLKLEVRNANSGAIRFYNRHGYHIIGKCSDTSIYMIKSLLEDLK